jgi:uncharacterized membrane protein YphA (DoxX/SURF4 family)
MNVALLIVRLVLGGVFIVAGAAKIGHPDVFAAEIAGFQMLPEAVIRPLALILPFLEVLLGGYLALGLYARAAGWVAAIQLVIFAVAIGSAVARGMTISCGCFGPDDRTVTSWPEAGRDLALAVLALAVALRGAGRLSLDQRIGKVQ